jgi:hypothetical protein
MAVMAVTLNEDAVRSRFDLYWQDAVGHLTEASVHLANAIRKIEKAGGDASSYRAALELLHPGKVDECIALYGGR